MSIFNWTLAQRKYTFSLQDKFFLGNFSVSVTFFNCEHRIITNLSGAFRGGFFMLLMKAMNVHYTIGDKKFFDEKELNVYQGDKIGLIGKNGQGKSLLLKYLQGLTEAKPSVDWYCSSGYFEQLNSKADTNYLSGGEVTIKKLNDLFSQGNNMLFLDEPSNNLDWSRIEELQTG